MDQYATAPQDLDSRINQAVKPKSRIAQIVDDALTVKPRFPDEDLYMRWYYGDKPTSKLARRIINAYLNDKSITIIIHGDPRIGKSGYAFKTLVQVYDYLFSIRDPILLYNLTMGYRPTEMIQRIRMIKRPVHWYKRFRTAKMPALIWDDGGIWLFNQDYAKAHVKEIMKLFQILFTKVQVMIITTPTPANLVKGLRSIPSAVWIQVRRDDDDPEFLGVEPDSVRYGRSSRIYTPFMSADLKTLKVWKNFEENFDCRFPDSAYKHYGPIRNSYTEKQEDLIYFTSMANDKKAQELEGKRLEALNKIIPDLYITG